MYSSFLSRIQKHWTDIFSVAICEYWVLIYWVVMKDLSEDQVTKNTLLKSYLMADLSMQQIVAGKGKNTIHWWSDKKIILKTRRKKGKILLVILYRRKKLLQNPITKIESNCKSLPRPADSNGIIVVKLKRKNGFRRHVLFEPVRPRIIESFLNYSKIKQFSLQRYRHCFGKFTSRVSKFTKWRFRR